MNIQDLKIVCVLPDTNYFLSLSWHLAVAVTVYLEFPAGYAVEGIGTQTRYQ